LSAPFGTDLDQAGNLYFVEMTGYRVRKLDTSGFLRVVAGTGVAGDDGDHGPALRAPFNGMHNLALAPECDIYLSGNRKHPVRKIEDGTQKVVPVAGTGKQGAAGDGGPATQATFGGIYCASLDPKAEQLYLADLDNLRIRAVDLQTGRVRTVAGNGQRGVPAD